MQDLHFYPDPYFTALNTEGVELPEKFVLSESAVPHPLCLLAASQLQQYLEEQSDWQHNFGLSDETETAVIGKMFGVLVVRNRTGAVGYLAAFSGKLAGSNTHARFVPPVYDALTEEGFLNEGMAELARLSAEIKMLELQGKETALESLKVQRKEYSVSLQKQLFEHYNFLNAAGEKKNINEIFKKASYKQPPAGAGECAAPKLLQYAFRHQLEPLALAEFWWGLSLRSATWKHGHFYPCCSEKCGPILGYMLGASQA